jgi:transposase-like protein
MSKTSRRKFTSEFKTKVCLEAIKEQQTIEALSKKYDIHPTQINTWKKEFLAKASLVFEKDAPADQSEDQALKENLYAEIGRLKIANDFLKKKLQ